MGDTEEQACNALARIKADACDLRSAVARDLKAMIDAARGPDDRAAAEAAAAALRKRAGFQ